MGFWKQWWEKYKENVRDEREAKAAYDAAYKPIYKEKKIEAMRKKAVEDAQRHAKQDVGGSNNGNFGQF